MSSESDLLLSAYLDGELRGWRRWRFESRLRKDASLARELAELRALGCALRDADAVAPIGLREQAPAPELDLWPELRARLAAGERASEADEAPGGLAEWLRAHGSAGAGVAGAAAAALLAAVVWFVGEGRLGTGPAGREERAAVGPAPVEVVGTLRSLDALGSSVLVVDGEDVTIIWLVDARSEDV